jgi:hypothetical protein
MREIAAFIDLKRHEFPLYSDAFPSLGAHISGAEFQYPDLIWKEMCCQMALLVAESGGNKGQLTDLTNAICRMKKSPS